MFWCTDWIYSCSIPSRYNEIWLTKMKKKIGFIYVLWVKWMSRLNFDSMCRLFLVDIGMWYFALFLCNHVQCPKEFSIHFMVIGLRYAFIQHNQWFNIWLFHINPELLLSKLSKFFNEIFYLWLLHEKNWISFNNSK